MKPLRILAVLAGFLVLAPVLLTFVFILVNPVSTLMIGRWLTGARVEHSWTPLDEMAPILVRTVVASEDARFCRHWGVDPVEIRAAVARAGGEVEDARGASTITMQVAKNLFLWPQRSFLRKGLELPLALWLDLVLSKRRLLEIYLNVAEWGSDGEFGIAAGAARAFGLPPARLDARRAALLAVMLPNPRRRDAARPGPGLSRLAARLQARTVQEGDDIIACLGLP